MAKAKAVKEPKEKVKLTVSGIIADLEAGIDRRGIAAKYGLNFAQVKEVFQHPKLKGKKVHKAPGEAFDLVDDVEDTDETESDSATATVAGPGEAAPATTNAEGSW